MHKKTLSQQGFTLVELSVVVVIIAFLLAGGFVGKSMIRSAQLRETIGQYDRYLKAIKEFQDKYNALPGDFNRATAIWGAQAGGTATGLDATCLAVASDTTYRTVTCNGNGDGRVGLSTIVGGRSQQYEYFRFWQHLANAGLIDGKFTGVKGPTSDGDAEISYNVPAAKIDPGGWTFNYMLYTIDSAWWWADNYGHYFSLGAEHNNSVTWAPLLSPSEAQEIDDKIDDGKPGRGMVRAYRASLHPNCSTNDTTQDAATYNVAYKKTGACAPFFIVGF